MTLIPFHMRSTCIAGDEQLYEHMRLSIARGLPEIADWGGERDGVIAIVGSGPSVKGQLGVLRQMRKARTPIVAVNDVHDWLIENGIVPDYALTVDPDAEVWRRFTRKHAGVQYWISSQCHPTVFDHLADCDVRLWHPLITKGQTWPARKALIGGGSTSGLRAISISYVMGWRHFALFGLDSCLQSDQLRVDGIGPEMRTGDVREVVLGNGRRFQCNGAMASQAEQFQAYFDVMPDAQFYPYGDGLIQEIIRIYKRQCREVRESAQSPIDNTRASFIHCGDERSASYRYRAAIPAQELGLALNDKDAGILIFAKPQPDELLMIGKAKARGAKIIVDFCDDHLEWLHYQEALRMADAVTCPTPEMAAVIAGYGKHATVIPDPYEYPEVAPHVRWKGRLLWFGYWHETNKASLERILPQLRGEDLRIVSNFEGSIPWSYRTMLQEFARADIVVLPATEVWKSPNRAVEAIRQGCYVVAEPHPSINDIPGIWIGNIREGIEWTQKHSKEANQRLSGAQRYVADKYAPRTLASAWKTLIQSLTTSDVEKSAGLVGSMSI